jgi:hypothetical protein
VFDVFELLVDEFDSGVDLKFAWGTCCLVWTTFTGWLFAGLLWVHAWTVLICILGYFFLHQNIYNSIIVCWSNKIDSQVIWVEKESFSLGNFFCANFQKLNHILQNSNLLKKSDILKNYFFFSLFLGLIEWTKWGWNFYIIIMIES